MLAVESFCFGKNGEHHGSQIMALTQSRACLALGSLIRHLENRGDHDQASQLAERLETWLDKHGEGHYRFIDPFVNIFGNITTF